MTIHNVVPRPDDTIDVSMTIDWPKDLHFQLWVTVFPYPVSGE